MKLRCFTIASAWLMTLVTLSQWVSANDLFALRAKTQTKRCLPNHDYDHHAWPFTEPRGASATVIAVAPTNPTEVGKSRKPFHFRATAMQVDQVSLEQVGLTLYRSDGKLYASGRISCDGGDGGLIGGHVVIRLRAYVSHTAAAAPVLNVLPATTTSAQAPNADGQIPIATPSEVTRIPPDAYVVWESERRVWVSRARPETVSLVNPRKTFLDQATLRRHFDEITHIEVELQYQRDR